MDTGFFNDEFSILDLCDSRLVKRAISIGNRLISCPGSCIQAVFSSSNEARCAYDFFSNPKVRWLDMHANHQKQTCARIDQDDTDIIYLIQDSTFYNYTNHCGKLQMGTIGKQGRFTQLGLMQHTTLCVNATGIPLGVLGLDFIGYDDTGDVAEHRKGFDSVASSRWRRFAAQALTQLEHSDKKKIFLCDREADFFELLDDLRHASCDYVIRSKWDRATGEHYRKSKTKISDLFNDVLPCGSMMMDITDPHTHELRSTAVSFKRLEAVSIPPRFRGAGHPQNHLPPITLNILQATTPDEQWTLLTSLPVACEDDVKFVIKSYKMRWHIESFFKVLKTAYQADKVYLHASREAVQNLLTIINVAAFRTYWFIHQARQHPNEDASDCFGEGEIRAIALYANAKKNCRNKPPNPTIGHIYYQVAQLGGYKNKNNKYQPGILTIYRGIQKLNTITEMYNIMSTNT